MVKPMVTPKPKKASVQHGATFDKGGTGRTIKPQAAGPQAATDTFVGFEVVVPSVIRGSIFVMPPGTGDMISFIRFRSGTKAMPVAQAAQRQFQIVLDVPAGAGAMAIRMPIRTTSAVYHRTAPGRQRGSLVRRRPQQIPARCRSRATGPCSTASGLSRQKPGDIRVGEARRPRAIAIAIDSLLVVDLQFARDRAVGPIRIEHTRMPPQGVGRGRGRINSGHALRDHRPVAAFAAVGRFGLGALMTANGHVHLPRNH
jgi:hypothetical protein